MAALQISASMRGTVRNTSAAASRTESRDARSIRTNDTGAPAPSSSFRDATAAADFSTLRFSITTSAPLPSRIRAAWNPAPALAPVIR